MKSILTKITMGLLCASLAAAPATASIERAPKATTSESAAAGGPISVNSAVSGLNHSKVTRAQKREARKALISAIRKDGDTNTTLLVILALFIPPLAVFLHQGTVNSKFWISLVLTLLLVVPGIVYSILVITGVIK